MAADQVLVGLNKSRRLYNTRLRELNGYRNPMPAAGEKLVCLRNDKTKGLLNGGTWTIHALHGIRNDFIRMDVLADGEVRRQVGGGIGAQSLLRRRRRRRSVRNQAGIRRVHIRLRVDGS